jgi:SAM-dependent methyltransferase
VSRSRREYLRRLLGPMWLRPESALWYAHEAAVARDWLDPLQSPSLELGCMEGVSTFVMLGGEFGLGFDVYRDVEWSDRSHRWGSLAEDYYDKLPASRDVDILSRPQQRFDTGLAWKRSHVEKAARLGIHDTLVEHDPNEQLGMFEDGAFALVWGPNLYWIDRFEQMLGELRRIVRPDGRIVTVLPDRSALDHMLHRFADSTNPDWIANLDRGRHANISRQARTHEEWRELFSGAGLSVSRHEAFLPQVVFQVSDIGLRPLFPVLMNVYETLRAKSEDDLLRIKQHWIEVAEEFLGPLCDTEWMDAMAMPRVWSIFELRPA